MADNLAVDLTNCDREPIHIPGSIQPHGVLLVVDPVSSVVLQVAGNLADVTGADAGTGLGRPLVDVLGPEAAALVTGAGQTSEPRFLGSFRPSVASAVLLDLTLHLSDELLVLEIEPSEPHRQSAAEALTKVRRCLGELDAAPDLNALFHVAAHEARRLTAFDRVMIYRFLEDGAGCVAAEAKVDALDSWLNHHYPESDIPKQARALYLRNAIRVIPDAGYTPAPLCPPANPITGRPLDMSDCALRSVSPIHLLYLRNMGVAASMSVSIIIDGALWGLIAFHHQAPKLVPYETRELCKHLGQILSQQIKLREDAEQHQESVRLDAAREKLLDRVTMGPSLDQALADHIKEVQRALPANGAAVVVGTEVIRAGHAPSGEQVRDVVAWLLASCSAPVYETSSLAREHSPAEAYAADASGLLASVVSRDTPVLLLWFRAERVKTIDWAGNPHKSVEASSVGQLTPRRSFQIWNETVHHQSRPWSAAEIDAARRLGRALLELRQQQTLTGLNVQLRRTLSEKEALLAQKDLLMQEVNHRVQNSLQLVNSMLHLQMRETSDEHVKAHFEEASTRIMAISAVHHRLWRADHIQNVDFGSYLEELRDGLVEGWGNAWAGHINVRADHVMIPTNQAVVLALVITELLTNAVKYAYEGQPGSIDVRLKKSRNGIRVVVRDRGVGLTNSSSKTGLGSRLIRSLITQLDGELEVSSAAPGTSATLIVPTTPSRVS
jgi:two-component system, chemotaxis family, sensor kinase Cph1